MRRLCYICHTHFGDAEPLDDESETHGICESCTPIEEARIKRQMRELKGKRQEIKLISESELPKCGPCSWNWEHYDIPIFCRLGLDAEECEGPSDYPG